MRHALLFVLLAGCGGAPSEALAPVAADLDASPSTPTEAGVPVTHPRGAQQGRGDGGDPPADADAPDATPDVVGLQVAMHDGAVDAALEAATPPEPCTGDAGPENCPAAPCGTTGARSVCCNAVLYASYPNRCGCTGFTAGQPDPSVCVYAAP